MSTKSKHHGKPSWVYDDEQRAWRYYTGLKVIRSLMAAWTRWLMPLDRAGERHDR